MYIKESSDVLYYNYILFKDNYEPKIGRLGFHIPHLIILIPTESIKTIYNTFDSIKISDIKVINYYSEK